MTFVNPQPRAADGKFGERPEVGMAQRLSRVLREALGHDGIDGTTTEPDLAEFDDRLAEQEAVGDMVELALTAAEKSVPLMEVKTAERHTSEDSVTVRDDGGRAWADDTDSLWTQEPGADPVRLGPIDDLDAFDQWLAFRDPPPPPADLTDAPDLVGVAERLDVPTAHDAAIAVAGKQIVVSPEVKADAYALLADVETKVWNPREHPRDHRGRFISLGSVVSLPNMGGNARVTGTAGDGKIEVRKADGTVTTVNTDDVEVIEGAPARPDTQFGEADAEVGKPGQVGKPGTPGTFAATPAAAAKPDAKPDAKPAVSKEDLDALPAGSIVGRRNRTMDRYTKNPDGTWTGEADGVTVGAHRVPLDGYEVLNDQRDTPLPPSAAPDKPAGSGLDAETLPTTAAAMKTRLRELAQQERREGRGKEPRALALDVAATTVSDRGAMANGGPERQGQILAERAAAMPDKARIDATIDAMVELADELDAAGSQVKIPGKGSPRLADYLRQYADAYRGQPSQDGGDGKQGEEPLPPTPPVSGGAPPDDGINRASWGESGLPPLGADGKGTRKDGNPYGSGYQAGDPRTDPAYDQYVEKIEVELRRGIDLIGDSQRQYRHTAPPKGVDYRATDWTVDRAKIHKKILDDFMEQYKDVPRERRAIVMAGPPGAGKTTVAGKRGDEFGVVMGPRADGEGDEPKNFATVNPDDIKTHLAREAMPETFKELGLAPDEMASLFHEESSDLAKELQRRLEAGGYNILLDGTFAGDPDKQAGKVRKLKEDGYTVTGVLVDGNVDDSLTRAAARHRGRTGPATPGGNYTGRYVPYDVINLNRPPTGTAPSDVLGREHRSTASINFERAAMEFDGGAHWYDNTTGEALPIHTITPEEVQSGNLRPMAAPQTGSADAQAPPEVPDFTSPDFPDGDVVNLAEDLADRADAARDGGDRAQEAALHAQLRDVMAQAAERGLVVESGLDAGNWNDKGEIARLMADLGVPFGVAQEMQRLQRQIDSYEGDPKMQGLLQGKLNRLKAEHGLGEAGPKAG